VRCRHFGVCGGCSLPDRRYSDQLLWKRSRLARLLEIDVPPVLPSPREAGFRTKIAFVFGTAARERTLVMGHYAAGSNEIIPVEECPVHVDRGNRIAFALRDRLAHAGVTAADTPDGVLRHLIIRTTENGTQAVATLVVTRNDKSLRRPVRALLTSPDRPDGFFVNIHDKPGPYLVGRETVKIEGGDRVRETGMREVSSRPLDFLVSPTAFFQTNVGAARELVRLVGQGVGSAKRVLDLYCGSGLFTLPLAADGATVIAVEEDREAIADLKVNLRLNRFRHGLVRPVCARVEDSLGRLDRDAWDAVVLDPPRDGCAPGVLRGVFERLAPARAVYVSCNPETLARDLPIMRQAGYRVERVQAVDMFPHTEHIETVVVLHRRDVGFKPARSQRRIDS
jgi:23S rRNA (uracil1939-C5)-methyltransferase